MLHDGCWKTAVAEMSLACNDVIDEENERGARDGKNSLVFSKLVLVNWKDLNFTLNM